MNTLEEWTAAVCTDLGIDPATADTHAVLDLARDVAHAVASPAAPLTAYLVGVAVGKGLDPEAATRRVLALTGRWDGQEKAKLPDSYGRPRRLASLVRRRVHMTRRGYPSGERKDPVHDDGTPG